MKVTIEVYCKREGAMDDVSRVVEQIKKISGAWELCRSDTPPTENNEGAVCYYYEIH